MGMMTARQINEKTQLQAALPAIEVSRLNRNLGIGMQTLRAFAVIIMIVSALSIFISLYNRLKDRRYEMALLRSLGASPAYLLHMVLLEGLMLAALGGLFGLIFSRIGMAVLSSALTAQYHYDFSQINLLPAEGVLWGGAVLLGGLAALLPAIQAYRTEIADTLTHA
ncbi:MAG: FtsX-like permease family protein, partial [Bacteroidota bacterium]